MDSSEKEQPPPRYGANMCATVHVFITQVNS